LLVNLLGIETRPNNLIIFDWLPTLVSQGCFHIRVRQSRLDKSQVGIRERSVVNNPEECNRKELTVKISQLKLFELLRNISDLLNFFTMLSQLCLCAHLKSLAELSNLQFAIT
jgi:hypothetical protein